jgi:hypothetical protein
MSGNRLFVHHLCRLQVSVYTFAAPRVGNHAYARNSTQSVPDMWNVINDQVRVPLHPRWAANIDVPARWPAAGSRALKYTVADSSSSGSSRKLGHGINQLTCSATAAGYCCSGVQDTVPRGGKLISAYKRSGQRVVINKIGDIVVSSAVNIPSSQL